MGDHVVEQLLDRLTRPASAWFAMGARTRLLVAGATTVVLGFGLLVWAGAGSGGCDGTVPLRVAVAPEIAPTVRTGTKRWLREAPRIDDRCIAPRIVPTDPAAVAATIAAERDQELDVAGARPVAEIPDVWIPDSTTWLTRIRAIDRQVYRADSPSIAMSPVVLAIPEPAAREQGWPAEQISWEYALTSLRGESPSPVGIVEPRRSATGLSGLLVTGKLATSVAKIAGKDADTAVLGTYRGLALARAGSTDELLARMPKDPGGPDNGPLRAALLTEREVRAYDDARPSVPLAAVYPEPAAPALDYPYAIRSALSGAKSQAAGQLRRWLSNKRSRALLTSRGFRTPDGAVGPDFPTGNGVTPQPVAPPRKITAKSIDRSLGLWTEVSLASRVLAVVDISGSMAEPVPGADGLSRLEVTRRAAAKGLGLFTADSELGLWVFSTFLDGGKDHRKAVRVAPLAGRRDKLARALAKIQVKPGGGTGLFDTIRDAYRTMVRDYDPEKSNTIVVMTDGNNQDPDGLSKTALIKELKRLSKPDRPVHLVVIGIGAAVDKAELGTITKATGGDVYLVRNPAKIGRVFLRALALPSR